MQTTMEELKMIYAGTVSFEDREFDAYVREDRMIVVPTRDNTGRREFVSIGHITNFNNKVADMFGAVNLWKIHADNFTKKSK